MDNRFGKFFNKITDTTVKPGDEAQEANNLRNKLANAVNPLLEEYVNPVLPEAVQLAIPKMTVADDKQYFAGLPEQMGGTMGSIGNAARFAKTKDVFGVKPNPGTVKVVPTAADLAADASKAAMQGKQLKANEISAKFDEMFGAEAAARKADMKKGLITPDGYSSWKQEMMNKIRGM